MSQRIEIEFDPNDAESNEIYKRTIEFGLPPESSFLIPYLIGVGLRLSSKAAMKEYLLNSRDETRRPAGIPRSLGILLSGYRNIMKCSEDQLQKLLMDTFTASVAQIEHQLGREIK